MLRGGTIQHGRSDQLCFYSETVGPDWSGMRTSRTYARCNQVRTRGATKYVREVRMRTPNPKLVGVSIVQQVRT
jgi:hypothetical protein